ncbi:MAG: energy transducer TonB [Prevotella sp.]|jgi:protein TonB|nr:energy transducer TonB [Prevotella sp.]
MKKIFTFIAVCLMSLQFATAQEVCFAETIQEQMPEFVGGEEALTEWIENNISYPMMAEVYSIEGKVVVAFDINEDGSVGNVQLESAADPIFADEVVSRIEKMPQWIPGMQNGRYVKVRYTLPISFVF